jgi:MFS family permease
MGLFTTVEGASDPILTRMSEEDKVKWYKKPNLRHMYIYLFLCCMGVEMTSGFDSSLINVLQFSPAWNKCKLSSIFLWELITFSNILFTDFSDGTKDDKGAPVLSASLLGFVSSCYQLGSIIGVPFAPWFNQRFGRRWAIMAGSCIMIVGALIQGFAQNGTYDNNPPKDVAFSCFHKLIFQSWNVHLQPHGPWLWNCHMHHRRLCVDRRTWPSKGPIYLDLPI